MDLKTHVISVVVYPDRARVTRQGSARLKAGLHKLEISELPVSMDPDSARVTARGSAQSRLYAVQVQPTFYPGTPDEQIRGLEAQLEIAQDELAGLDARIKTIGLQQTHQQDLAGNTWVFASALAAGQASLDQQLDIFDRLREKSDALGVEVIGLGQRKRGAQQRVSQLQAQLDQVRSLRPHARFTAWVEVEILQPGDLTVDLSYLVAGAGWKPLYDLRLIEEGGKTALEVGYLAEVVQNSGEDWADILLTLSTARPAQAAVIPELRPWYIQPLPPPRPLPAVSATVKKAEYRMVDSAMFSPAPAGESIQAEEAYATVDQTSAAVTYGISGTASIPPDGSAHKAVITRYPLSPRLDYVSAPGIASAAYRRVKVVNDSPYVLLPGKVSLFAGDEFIGATRIELTAPNGEIELFLGVDDRVKIERELVRREVEKTLIGGKRRLRYGYETRVENLLPAPVELNVRDQYPVSRHEEIKVRLESVEPRPEKQDELNQLEWKLVLAPQEKAVLRFNFVIEYPPTMQVIGLADQ